MAETETVRTIQVVLKTDTQYAIPMEPYMLPISWRRYHLSQLINKVLSLASPIPFDFIINGEILTSSLGDWCAEKALGEEETLEIEYIPSILPPQKLSSLPHSDWVSSVSLQKRGAFITGSYDTTIRIFNHQQELVQSIEGHTAPISHITLIPSKDGEGQLLVSSSYDTTARITRLSEDNSSSVTLASLHLHSLPISSISSNPSGDYLLTAGWDSLIGLWSTSIPETDEVPIDPATIEPSRKRRKVATTSQTDVRRKAPTTVLRSHTSRVSRALFSPDDNGTAYSAGYDCTLRSWDLENGLSINTTTSAERVMVDLGITPDAKSALVACADRTVLLYSTSALDTDPRPIIFSHTSAPVALATHPTSSHHFLSLCQDGIVRLWDTRSSKNAIANFEGFSEGGNKGRGVTSITWGSDDVVAIGGESGLTIAKAGISS